MKKAKLLTLISAFASTMVAAFAISACGDNDHFKNLRKIVRDR